MLIEPLGADLDLHRDFREEYGASFFFSQDEVPPRVSVFLSRHGIVPARRLRIEERSIKPEDAIFIAGTLTENPGVQVRPFSPLGDSLRDPVPETLAEPFPSPQIVKLSGGASPTSTREMSQQAKIAAALTRAGITKPEAWSAAGVPYQSVAVEECDPPAPVSAYADVRPNEVRPNGARPNGNKAKPSNFNLTPPVVLMKGENNPTFVISFRSQKEFVSTLAWKSAAMIWGGAAIALLGLYMLWAQLEMNWVLHPVANCATPTADR